MNLPDPMTQFDEQLALEREVEARRMEDERQLCDLFKKDVYAAAQHCAHCFNDDFIVREYFEPILSFAESYSWPAVFRVLAAAIHEHEQLCDRR